MNRRLRAPLCLGFAVLAAVDSASTQTLDLNRIETVADSVAHAQIAAGAAPGMSVAVAKDGQIVFTRGYGQTNVEMGVVTSPETVYEIGSITKQFTAATIMRLVEAGRISLDDPITKFLPDYPTNGHRVMVRHLLNHTSGIKDYYDLNREARRRFSLDLSYQEMVELLGAEPFNFAPGERFDYSNSGYYLLAEIVERVTGTPFHEHMQKAVLQPLGLTSIVSCDPRRVIANRAEGYTTDREGEFAHASFFSMSVERGAGGLCSTAADLIRWTHLLHEGTVVSPNSLEQMTAPTMLADGNTRTYGFGLDLAQFHGRRAVLHNGSTDGFRSYLVHYPEDAVTIAVLMNSGRGKPDAVQDALARTAFGIELNSPLDLPLSPEDVARYEGTYTFAVGEIQVLSQGGHLHIQIPGMTDRLRYQGEHVFIPAKDDKLRLVFTDLNGRAEGATLHMGGRTFQGTRNP